jgi:hypothetical protein
VQHSSRFAVICQSLGLDDECVLGRRLQHTGTKSIASQPQLSVVCKSTVSQKQVNSSPVDLQWRSLAALAASEWSSARAPAQISSELQARGYVGCGHDALVDTAGSLE